MASNSLCFEDKLDGGGNFLSWKANVALFLKEHEIWYIVDKTMTIPTDEALKAVHKKREIKAQRLILDAVKDHLILRVREY